MKGILLALCLVMTFSLVAAQDVSVTVYNSNLGVVSETRSLEFQKGVNRLAFKDVPSAIDPASVQFSVVGAGHTINILEQNYAFDLVSADQMYNKYIDNQIDLIDKDGKLYSGTLLAYGSGSVTLKDKSEAIKIVQLANIAEVNFPALPDGLITRPTLFWMYNSDYSGILPCKVGYQTSGLGWSAEYVGLLSSDEKNLDLSGWASINNTSGKTYKDATLKLIAGDIHRATPPAPGRTMMKGIATAEMDMGGFEEKSFFEYHLYTLPRKATVADKEIKQISLFEPAQTQVKKVFMFRPDRNAKQVEVDLNFKNSKQTGLGLPLPAGRTRIFQTDTDGSLILLGEDNIDHTPVDEEVNLNIGYAFDITAEERVANQTQISSKVQEQDIEVELANHKKEAVTVEVEKKLWGYWEIMQSSIPFEKKDAYTVDFKVPVPSDSTVVLKYKVRFTYR